MSNYQLKTSVFNQSEAAFLLELRKQLPLGYCMFPKIRLIDFIKVKPSLSSWIATHKIWAKHVDFLICDPNFKPVLAIEVDGKSHLSPLRVARDIFVKQIYQQVGLSFIAIKVGSNFALQANKVVALL